MEKETIGLIVLAIFIILAFFVITLIEAYKRYQSLIYVHTKTGNKYRIIQSCKMKYDGKWMDAIVYVSKKNSEVFVREYSNFTLNFKRLSEWKKD